MDDNEWIAQEDEVQNIDGAWVARINGETYGPFETEGQAESALLDTQWQAESALLDEIDVAIAAEEIRYMADPDDPRP